mmetsp:Transcript_32164/g.36504  ORF Transcript_32164/g.36504 Transcript_32164/m.36504 type:complete len:217 (-) Transcript_32164:229-879(-)
MNVLVVTAAANTPTTLARSYNGIFNRPNVLVVGSACLNGDDPNNRKWEKCYFSEHGPGVDMYAPGADVILLQGDLTDTQSIKNGVGGGTSYSAPLVTAFVSVLLDEFPTHLGGDPAQLKQLVLCLSPKIIEEPQRAGGMVEKKGLLWLGYKQANRMKIQFCIGGKDVQERQQKLDDMCYCLEDNGVVEKTQPPFSLSDVPYPSGYVNREIFQHPVN